MMTTARALVSRVLRPLFKAAEGRPRSGLFHLPVTGSWLPDGTLTNFWQLGLSSTGGERSALVERCIALYAETAASLPGAHWRRNARGGRTRVRNSAPARVLQRPNDYETASSFMLNAMHSLYREGNTFALALRNSRFEVESLHLMDARMSAPLVANDGSIFFRLAGNDVISRMLGDDGDPLIVPARDVLHIKLHSSHRRPHPLVGETPLLAAMADIVVGDAFLRQQLQFLANQARPSAVLSTDLVLDKDGLSKAKDFTRAYADLNRWLEGATLVDASQGCAARGADKDIQRAHLLRLRHSAAAAGPRHHTGNLH
jgi:phage portal protein BeeE